VRGEREKRRMGEEENGRQSDYKLREIPWILTLCYSVVKRPI